MKKFLKKFAFVLAATVATTTIVPAATVSAATEPTLKQSSKVLYVGGDETGNIGDTYRFTFNNAKGYTATWKSSKKSVATVDAKSGNIQAVAVGTTGIYATLTNKTGNAVELDAKVYVKQNAEKIGFGSLAAVKKALAVGDKVKVNVYRQVGTTKVWAQADKTLITDTVVWTSSDANVATVDKWGKITAVAAGKATITATATQKEGNVAVVSKSFPVEVAAGLTAVKQTSINTIAATFAGDLSAVATKDNVKVYSMVGSTKVNVLVKEVKFDTVDKTKAVITTYTDLVKGTEYVVEYATTSSTFKAADLSKTAVASLKITTAEAVKGEATAITVKAYDANGVEIPSSVVAGYIDLSADSSVDYYFDAAEKKVTFFNTGKTATIKASFHTYTYGADYKEITVDAQAVITSVDKATLTVKSADVFTVYKGDVDFAKASSTLSISDKDGSYKVAVKVTTSENKELKSTDAADKFSFSSSDSTTLLVSGTTLYPVKEGGAVVIVKYGDTVIGAYPVTIGAARVASDVVATLDRATLSSTVAAQDSVKLTVTTKDQFGVDRTGVDTVKVEYVTGPADGNKNAPTASGSKNNEFVFTGAAYSKAGTYQFKVTVGNQVRWISFEVKDAGTSVAYYQLSNAGKSVDTALKVGKANDTDSKAFTMALAAYASNGYKVANINLVNTSKAAAYNSLGTSTGTAIYVEISAPSGKTAADIAPFVSVSGNAVQVNPVVVSGSFIKAPEGTYTVTVKEVTRTTTTATQSDIDAAATKALIVGSFVVTDTQTKAAVTVNKTTSASADVLTALKNKDDVITIKLGDVAYNDTIVKTPETIGTGKTINVVKAQIVVDVQYAGVVGTMTQDVAIGQTITLQ